MAFSLADGIARQGPAESGYKSWFDHLKFNPSGSRLLFLHRWAARAVPGHHGFFTRMITVADGSRPWCSSKAVAFHTSIGTMTRRFSFGCGPTKAASTTTTWSTILRANGEVRSAGQVQVDGHCNFSPNRQWIVTDTYPKGPENKQTLIL